MPFGAKLLNDTMLQRPSAYRFELSLNSLHVGFPLLSSFWLGSRFSFYKIVVEVRTDKGRKKRKKIPIVFYGQQPCPSSVVLISELCLCITPDHKLWMKGILPLPMDKGERQVGWRGGVCRVKHHAETGAPGHSPCPSGAVVCRPPG